MPRRGQRQAAKRSSAVAVAETEAEAKNSSGPTAATTSPPTRRGPRTRRNAASANGKAPPMAENTPTAAPDALEVTADVESAMRTRLIPTHAELSGNTKKSQTTSAEGAATLAPAAPQPRLTRSRAKQLGVVLFAEPTLGTLSWARAEEKENKEKDCRPEKAGKQARLATKSTGSRNKQARPAAVKRKRHATLLDSDASSTGGDSRELGLQVSELVVVHDSKETACSTKSKKAAARAGRATKAKQGRGTRTRKNIENLPDKEEPLLDAGKLTISANENVENEKQRVNDWRDAKEVSSAVRRRRGARSRTPTAADNAVHGKKPSRKRARSPAAEEKGNDVVIESETLKATDESQPSKKHRAGRSTRATGKQKRSQVVVVIAPSLAAKHANEGPNLAELSVQSHGNNDLGSLALSEDPQQIVCIPSEEEPTQHLQEATDQHTIEGPNLAELFVQSHANNVNGSLASSEDCQPTLIKPVTEDDTPLAIRSPADETRLSARIEDAPNEEVPTQDGQGSTDQLSSLPPAGNSRQITADVLADSSEMPADDAALAIHSQADQIRLSARIADAPNEEEPTQNYQESTDQLSSPSASPRRTTADVLANGSEMPEDDAPSLALHSPADQTRLSSRIEDAPNEKVPTRNYQGSTDQLLLLSPPGNSRQMTGDVLANGGEVTAPQITEGEKMAQMSDTCELSASTLGAAPPVMFDAPIWRLPERSTPIKRDRPNGTNSARGIANPLQSRDVKALPRPEASILKKASTPARPPKTVSFHVTEEADTSTGHLETGESKEVLRLEEQVARKERSSFWLEEKVADKEENADTQPSRAQSAIKKWETASFQTSKDSRPLSPALGTNIPTATKRVPSHEHVPGEAAAKPVGRQGEVARGGRNVPRPHVPLRRPVARPGVGEPGSNAARLPTYRSGKQRSPSEELKQSAEPAAARPSSSLSSSWDDERNLRRAILSQGDPEAVFGVCPKHVNLKSMGL